MFDDYARRNTMVPCYNEKCNVHTFAFRRSNNKTAHVEKEMAHRDLCEGRQVKS